MSDLISRQTAIDAMEDVDWYHINSNGQLVHGANSKEDEPLYKAEDVYKVLNDMPSAQPESLTDKEQRIFLAAMGREEKVCKQVDEECRDCGEAYEDNLVKTCHEIIRKVKGALWMI